MSSESTFPEEADVGLRLCRPGMVAFSAKLEEMMILAYVGPENLFPVVSFLAGIMGVLLMLGRRALLPFVLLYRFLMRRSK